MSSASSNLAFNSQISKCENFVFALHSVWSEKHRLITAHMHESTSSHRQTWPDSIIVIMIICNDW